MNFLHNLLPLPSGYFGASSTLYELGGIIVVYGPAGGAWHINIEDEPRWYRGKTTIVGAGLLEMDVILGKDPEFVERIVNVAQDLNRNFVALCGTPVSAIIGVDLRGLTQAIQKRLNTPVLCIKTSGTESYLEGAEKANLAVAQVFLKSLPKVPNSVNILGAIHLDVGHLKHLKPLISLLESSGHKVISTWGFSPLDDIKKSSSASLNLVVGLSGLSLAQYMYEAFKIPYIVGIPIGEKLQEYYLKLIKGKDFSLTFNLKSSKKALIIGEPIMALSLKFFLEAELNIKSRIISVLPLKNLLSTLKELQNSFIRFSGEDEFSSSESRISDLMNQSDIDYIIADPLYERLLYQKRDLFPYPMLL
ncbi:MAG TPA: hypothetical protein ENO30_02595 [Thermodesulfobium narugense]|nr:hypothetical protein [Thermodesulfobium narugense]